MVCVFLILVGVLLLEGKWWEQKFLHKRAKPLPILLTRYTDTTATKLREVEHEYVEQLKREDPTLEHQLELKSPVTQTTTV